MDEQINENAKSILDVFKESEITHDKNLTFITAGALGLSLTFLDKIVSLQSAKCRGFIIVAWVSFLLSLIINLLSHRIIADFTLDKYHEFLNSDNDKTGAIGRSFVVLNRRARFFNWVSVIFLIIGIILFVIFCTINIS